VADFANPNTHNSHVASEELHAVVAVRSPGRILVVDDDIAIGRSLHRLLCREHDVSVESDARCALARITAGEIFDVVFCDLTMPHMNGMDFFAALQTSHPATARRVIFLTAGTFSPAARDFLASVANLSVSKPFSIATIRAVARRYAGPTPP
jgi:CheY-like chemotaxis protein